MRNLTKGQTILAVVMWATGISVAVGGAVYSQVSSKFEKNNQTVLNHEGRLSSVETEIKRLPEMEKKLDALLINQGINPDKVK